jgi:hypothetical protein
VFRSYQDADCMLVATEIHRERMARFPSRRSHSYGPRRRQQRHTGVVGSTQGRRLQGTAGHTRLVSAGLVSPGARATLPVPRAACCPCFTPCAPLAQRATSDTEGNSGTQFEVIRHTNTAGAHDLQRWGHQRHGHPEACSPRHVPPVQGEVNRKRPAQVPRTVGQGSVAIRAPPTGHHIESPLRLHCPQQHRTRDPVPFRERLQQ